MDEPTVDYRALLKKYIRHVAAMEGSAFIEGYDGYFTYAEFCVLDDLDREDEPSLL